MANRYRKLLSNSFTFAIGNLGSKLLSFFMLPLYTYSLSTSEYGEVDLITTMMSLILPIITLSVYESVLRFSMDDSYDKKEVFSTGFFISLVSSTVLILLIVFFIATDKFVWALFFGVLIMQIFQALFTQYIRAIGKVKIFSFNGILLTFIIAILNILFLVVFKLGVIGYILSILIGTLISNMYIFLSCQLYKEITNKFKFDIELNKEMFRYSIPLIPNSIAWWITNASSRYFILLFLGTASNGIFAVTNKIPTLLSIVNTIVSQAWQLSAIEEFKSKDRGKFFSEIFSFYFKFLFLVSSSILLILKFLMKYLVSFEFFIAWKYVPFLLLAVIYSSLSSFLGTNYTVVKKTNGIFLTTIVGAVINIILNLLLIPLIGLQGAGLSSAISYLMVLIIRIVHTKKYIKIEFDKKNIFLNHIIFFLQLVSLFFIDNYFLVFIQVFLFFICVIINKTIFLKLLSILNIKRSNF